MEADELYQVPPADFVPARDDLVRRLRAGGQREQAAALARRRRPSPTVWAVNRLAHDDPDLVADILAAAADVDAAQRSGDGSAVRDASTRLRRLLDQARRAAAALIGRSGQSLTAQLQRRLDSTLQGAAASSAGTRRALLEGRLEADVDPPGFAGDPIEDTPEVAAAIAPRRGSMPRRETAPPAGARLAPAESRAAGAATRGAEAALRHAEASRDRAADAARRRRQEAAALRGQADAADAAAVVAEAQVVELDAQVREAQAALDRVRGGVDGAATRAGRRR